MLVLGWLAGQSDGPWMPHDGAIVATQQIRFFASFRQLYILALVPPSTDKREHDAHFAAKHNSNQFQSVLHYAADGGHDASGAAAGERSYSAQAGGGAVREALPKQQGASAVEVPDSMRNEVCVTALDCQVLQRLSFGAHEGIVAGGTSFSLVTFYSSLFYASSVRKSFANSLHICDITTCRLLQQRQRWRTGRGTAALRGAQVSGAALQPAGQDTAGQPGRQQTWPQAPGQVSTALVAGSAHWGWRSKGQAGCGSSEAAGQPAEQVDVPASRHGTVLRPRRRERKEEPAGREKTTQAGEEGSRSCGRRGKRDRTCCDGISTADCGAGAASVSGEAAARRQPAAGRR